MEKESNDTIFCEKKEHVTLMKIYSLRNRNVSGKIFTSKIFLDEVSTKTVESNSVENYEQIQINVSHKSLTKAVNHATCNADESYDLFGTI